MTRARALLPLLAAGAAGARTPCAVCGHNCDVACNCGVCTAPGKCANEQLCLGPCNSGGNAKWCGGGATPTPAPGPAPPPAPSGTCTGCGHNCDAKCNCGICKTDGCMSADLCLGPCNSGGNAKWCGGGAAPTPAPAPGPAPPPAPSGACTGCGHNCDAQCNCGICKTDGCMSSDLCLGPCNSGGNAKWCGGGTAPTPAPAPAPPAPPPAPAGTCTGCGHNCDAQCNCGICKTDRCMSPDLCLGPCNSGGNAKWCGPTPPPTPAPPVTPAPPPVPPASWATTGNKVMLNGKAVTLRGMGTTCSEYLLSALGMTCWATYDYTDPEHVITKLNEGQMNAIKTLLYGIKSDTVVPTVRIPMCASSWLGVNTSAASAQFARFPTLGAQYQTMISEMVDSFTSVGIAAILDLHWSDDDTRNGNAMALKTRPDGPTGNTVEFWGQVAQKFAGNTRVFYELYNEPHGSDVGVWMHGNDQFAGMLELLAAVRQYDAAAPVIIAGYKGYAYDADSLVQLDAELEKLGEKNVMWSFHPYMGPNQAGDTKKCPDGFEARVKQVFNATDFPVIITEMGQDCCPTHGACEDCPGTYDGEEMGYDEAILTIAAKYDVSWLPWAWLPRAANGDGKKCEDINGGDATGTTLASAVDGKGADWATMWPRFAKGGSAPAPSGGCPGGSVSACMDLCPASPASAYKTCVDSCAANC